MKNLFDPSKLPVQAAVGLAVAGFVLITLGWNGAASVDFTQGQLPFLISGGVAGLALVLVGLTMALVNEMRRSTTAVLAKLEQLADRTLEAAGPSVVPGSGPHVVAGRTTYHLPTCRLVVERDDLQTMSPQEAGERGLAPCRICDASQATA
ncbi:MAG: hypothetical protein WEB03_05545 [Nitriliruptor sp.]|uniref:hypothetical protein n=1 Tax=Nitriliruptor sp. TaxID=2448056 RepID=UPI0034A0739F